MCFHDGTPGPLIMRLAVLYQRKGDYSNALAYLEKLPGIDSIDKEAWYTLGVNCWAWSYHGDPALSQAERDQVVDKGIHALERALAIDPDYFEAVSYIGLMYREKAKALTAVGKDAEAREALAKAEEYQNRAIEVRKRLMAKSTGS